MKNSLRVLVFIFIFGGFSFAGDPMPNTFVNTFNFFLDSSLASSGVTISKVFIPVTPNYDFNKYISCGVDDTKKPPIHLSGMNPAGYSCTQYATLDLKTGESYGLTGYIEIDANGQSIKINQNYTYCPWGRMSNPQDYGCSKSWHYQYFIYIDPTTGKLSYRPV